MKMGSLFFLNDLPSISSPLSPVLSFTLLLHNLTAGDSLLSLDQAQVFGERRGCPASTTSVTTRHQQVL